MAYVCSLCNGEPRRRCPRCRGKGSVGGFIGVGARTCEQCDGTGEVLCERCLGGEADFTTIRGIIEDGDEELAAYLVNKSSLLEDHDDLGQSLAHFSAEHGRLRVLHRIHEIAPGALSRPSQGGTTPAALAAYGAHTPCLDFIGQVAPESFGRASEKGHLPSHLCSAHQAADCLGVVHRFCPESLMAKSGSEWTPAHYACHYNSLSCVRFLVAHDRESFLEKVEGDTPANLAVREGHTDIIRVIANDLPAVLEVMEEGMSAASLAAGKGHLEILKVLRDKAPRSFLTEEAGGLDVAFLALSTGHVECANFAADALAQIRND